MQTWHELGDPEFKCYMPGVPRATYMPFPFRIVQGSSPYILIAYEYRQLHPHRPHEFEGGDSGAFVDGLVARPLGRRHAGGGRHRIPRGDLVRSRGRFP